VLLLVLAWWLQVQCCRYIDSVIGIAQNPAWLDGPALEEVGQPPEPAAKVDEQCSIEILFYW
jgi:hypothetical protein